MSNSLIVEEDSIEIGDLDSLSKSLSEPVDTPANADVVEAVKPEWCPDKFWNAETGVVDNERMAGSYASLESSYGQRGNEVGELRALSDKFLGLKRQVDLMGETEPADKPADTAAPISATELLERPREILDGLVRDAIAEHDDKEAASAAEVSALENESTFYTKHPEAETTARSPEFREWASQNRTRSRLMSHAAAGDLGAADDLLSEYAEANAPAPVTDDDPTVDPTERARALALESEGTSATTGTESKKTYRRADLIKLKMERPEEYALNEREILEAYAEKRVK
jgi:hypothetical protein